MSLTESKLTLGFSPCPNDTFIFDALVNNKLNTDGLTFEPILEDVETLNQLAKKGTLDITKLSFFAFYNVQEQYELIASGSALGRGVGPLLISKKKFDDPKSEIKSVAIPGKNTTAYLLLRIFFPELTTVKEMLFSEIETAVDSGSVDAGLIIHENRFTYQEKGLLKIADLGELWEQKTGMPLPLGGIAVRKNLSSDIKKRIAGLIRESVEYAFEHPESSFDYVKKHAQEMSTDVRQKHIDLYVNQYSVDLGEEGMQAVTELFEKAEKAGLK